ncbi:hypothetical protein [Trujillonella humicola]|uniref:hypothetical protein n=1 Tax=Trujillonella humicola TaxID=3383699 RepID=UPI003906672F
MPVPGVDGWRGRWAGALPEGRTARLLVPDSCAAARTARRIPDGQAQRAGSGDRDARDRPMRVSW